MIQLSQKTSSVVLLGTFDVKSFTPTALLKTEILTLTEATAADSVAVWPNRVSSFEIEGVKINVQNERAQVEVSAPPFIRAIDILSKAIRDNDTFPSKVTAVGMNVQAYYLLDDYKVRDILGRKLAPINAWGKWGEELAKADSYPAEDPKHSGMMGIHMRLPMFDDRLSGYIDVRVEPSQRVKAPEVFFSINDHYGASLDAEKAAKMDPLELLHAAETRFDSSMQRSDEIVASILEQAK